jgi:hypothetical protein
MKNYEKLSHIFYSGYLTVAYGKRSGFYLSSIAIIAGSLLMSLIDLHKRNLKNKNLKHRQHSKKFVVTNGSVVLNPASQIDGGSSHGPLSGEHPELASPIFAQQKSIFLDDEGRQMSFSEQDDVLPPMSLLSHQRSFIYDDIIGDLNSAKPELSLFSEEEGIADMDMPDHLFLDDFEFLDNITSCDKVENCVNFSEYEQNLIKETESPMQARRRLWPFGRQTSSSQVNNEMTGPVRMNLGVGGLRQSSFYGDLPLPKASRRQRSLPKSREVPIFPNTARRLQQQKPDGPKRRSITVIDEASV